MYLSELEADVLVSGKYRNNRYVRGGMTVNVFMEQDDPSKFDRLLCGDIWCILQLDEWKGTY